MTNGPQSCSHSIITCWSKWHYEDLRQLLENELWIRLRGRHCSMSPPSREYLASFLMWCHQCLWQPIHRQVSCTSNFKSALWHMKRMECQGMSSLCSRCQSACFRIKTKKISIYHTAEFIQSNASVFDGEHIAPSKDLHAKLHILRP